MIPIRPFGLSLNVAGQAADPSLAALIDGPQRSDANKARDRYHLLGNLETARWRHCGRPKTAAFSTSARLSAVGTYSAGISRSVSLNSGARARGAGN
jgi:hypothetical protein